MVEWLNNPAVIGGVFGILLAFVTPKASALIRRKENGRVTAAAAAQVAESQRIEASEKRLQSLFERQDKKIAAQDEELLVVNRRLRDQEAETEALEAKVRLLEDAALRARRSHDQVLSGIFGMAREVHDALVVNELTEAIARTRKIMDAAETARNKLFNGEKSA